MLERAMSCFESTKEVRAFEIRDIIGACREFADALASLLGFARREWSDCGGVLPSC